MQRSFLLSEHRGQNMRMRRAKNYGTGGCDATSNDAKFQSFLYVRIWFECRRVALTRQRRLKSHHNLVLDCLVADIRFGSS